MNVWFRQNPFNHEENDIELDLQIIAWELLSLLYLI